jgi:hypothetical protein
MIFGWVRQGSAHWRCDENSAQCRVGVQLVGVQDSGFLHEGSEILIREVGFGDSCQQIYGKDMLALENEQEEKIWQNSAERGSNIYVLIQGHTSSLWSP